MRIVIAEDMALLREGLTRLLADAGFDIAGGTGDLPGLLELVDNTAPDAALIDIKMPPTFTDEGLQAATLIRQRHPTHRGSPARGLLRCIGGTRGRRDYGIAVTVPGWASAARRACRGVPSRWRGRGSWRARRR